MRDRLLRDLGDLARSEAEAEEACFGDRWDRLAAGTLTADEEAELKALAESSPEHREAYEAFRPLGADFQARVLSAIEAEQGGETPQLAPPEPRPRVLPFRRAAVRRVEVWLGATAAVAAAATFFFLQTSAPLPPLPLYQAELIGGDKIVRGSEPGPASGTPIFSPGSMLKLALRPQPPQPVQGRLEAQAFRVSAGGGTTNWVPIPGFSIKNGADGTLLLIGTVGETIQLPIGTSRICVVVSRPGKAPAERDLPAALGARHAAWKAVCADPLRAKERSPT